MVDRKVRKLVISALMAALTCIATMVVQIPSPMNGYVNLGDCFVLLSGWLLGPWYGGAAAGIGSMLTDLLSGYGYYAPGTFFIKGLDALAAALIFRAMGRTSAAALVSGVVGEIIMVAGYFGYAALLMGEGIGAAASIPGNLVQGVVGLLIGFLLLKMVKKTRIAEKI
ncbi:MAG: ECF transporter S component [Ruminococcaceae bacterium]|nr:ECF transporter S component [Oscillospiraceae bacterium]